jgi:hypothetical protein
MTFKFRKNLLGQIDLITDYLVLILTTIGKICGILCSILFRDAHGYIVERIACDFACDLRVILHVSIATQSTLHLNDRLSCVIHV